MNKLPETLKRLRQQKGVYLKEVAPFLGVSVGSVSNYEHGVHSPDPDTLIQLADYYGVSIDYLVGHTDCPYPVSTINRKIYGEYTVRKFLELLDRLPDQEMQYLVYVLEMFELRATSEKRF